MTEYTDKNLRERQLKELAESGDECAAADLFKEFGVIVQEAHDDAD